MILFLCSSPFLCTFFDSCRSGKAHNLAKNLFKFVSDTCPFCLQYEIQFVKLCELWEEQWSPSVRPSNRLSDCLSVHPSVHEELTE